MSDELLTGDDLRRWQHEQGRIGDYAAALAAAYLAALTRRDDR